MEIVSTVLLALGAFWLGAVPFSIVIGRWILHKDIRAYGDGNPGAANVFRAGGHKAGWPAVLLDIAKGVPFVLVAHLVFAQDGLALAIIAICPILGHAFSPFLKGRGGKAIAVTFGVLMALPQPDILFVFTAIMVLSAMFIRANAWVAIFGSVGTLTYLALTGAEGWKILLMLTILGVMTVKHLPDLHSLPGLGGFLYRWIQSIVRGHTTSA